METHIHMSDENLNEAIRMWVADRVGEPHTINLIHIRVHKGGEYEEPKYGALVKIRVLK